MAHLLIDELGEIWPAESRELRERLFCRTYQGDLARDLVRNLGFIHLTSSKPCARVRLNSRNVSAAAIAGLAYWLHDNLPSAITIEFEAEARPIELISSIDAAVERLAEINRQALLARRVRAEHVKLDELLLTPSPLSPLFNYWREQAGVCEVSSLIELSRAHLADRCFAVSADDYRFLAAGFGLQIPDAAWLSTAREQRLDQHPDLVYRNWLMDIYHVVKESERPDLADVEAQIYWPAAGTVRRTYRRLLLPCRTQDNKKILFGANTQRGNFGVARQTK